jgi:hypothetical protein
VQRVLVSCLITEESIVINNSRMALIMIRRCVVTKLVVLVFGVTHNEAELPALHTQPGGATAAKKHGGSTSKYRDTCAYNATLQPAQYLPCCDDHDHDESRPMRS